MTKLNYNTNLEYILSNELKSISKQVGVPLSCVVLDYWEIMKDLYEKRKDKTLREEQAIRYLRAIYDVEEFDMLGE